MRGTCLVYSSHNRSEYIHNELIVQRALQGQNNKRILVLPMSQTPQNGDERNRQEYEYGTFSWYFRSYEQYGLEYLPFFWSSMLSRKDVDQLWYHLFTAEVVILAGGNSETGLARYKALGAHFDGEPGKFGRLLHERQSRGLLTVGFSAGADQLGENLSAAAWGSDEDTNAFGLARNVMTTLHHEPGREKELVKIAQNFPHCMAFGLPNDSGLLVEQGMLPSGNLWQVIRFVIDTSWNLESDHWHIKTRQGIPIEHYYSDGRHWSFYGHEALTRVQSQDMRYQGAWVAANGRVLDYWSQEPSQFGSIEHILGNH